MPASRRFLMLMTVLAILLSACGKSSSGATDKTKLDSTYAPQKSLAEAVDAVLADNKKGDYAASFAVLAPDARTQYKDVADWTKRQNELAPATAFKTEKSPDSTTQIVTVEHTPSIDPFKGLIAAKETQTWKGHKYDRGWLVEPDPQTDPILPPDSTVGAAVKSWVAAVQACDKDRAHALQAVDTLIATATPSLCKASGDITVSDPSKLTEGPDSSKIVEQYSTDALVWARTVAVTGPAQFNVVVAPIGNDWKVLALY